MYRTFAETTNKMHKQQHENSCMKNSLRTRCDKQIIFNAIVVTYAGLQSLMANQLHLNMSFHMNSL